MPVTTVSSKGWVVIPHELRKKHHLQAGTRVTLVDYGGILAIVPTFSDPVKESAGMLKTGSLRPGSGQASLVQALLDERAREHAREK